MEVKAAEEPKPPRVSVLVVSCDRRAELEKCLVSLAASEGAAAFEVIVAINGSQDGSSELQDDFPQFTFLRLPRNFGLTRALNIAIRSAKAEYILLLHDDVELSPGCVSALAAHLDTDPDTFAAVPLLLDGQGSPAPQVRALPSPEQPFPEWQPAPVSGAPASVAYASGAALLVRAFVFRAIRQIEESYGVFGSDAVICAQVRRAGKKVTLLPGVTAIHRPPVLTSPTERAARAADEASGTIVFIERQFGFGAALKLRMGLLLRYFFSSFTGEFGYRFGRFSRLLSGGAITGT